MHGYVRVMSKKICFNVSNAPLKMIRIICDDLYVKMAFSVKLSSNSSVLHNLVTNRTIFSVFLVRRFTILKNIQFEMWYYNARDARAVKRKNSLSSHMNDI